MTSIKFEFSGFVSVSISSVDGAVVGKGFVAEAYSATVGGGFVGAETVAIGVGGAAVGDDAGVGADVQAATKTTARMSTII